MEIMTIIIIMAKPSTRSRSEGPGKPGADDRVTMIVILTVIMIIKGHTTISALVLPA